MFKKNISDGVGSRDGSNGTPLNPPLFWLDNIFKYFFDTFDDDDYCVQVWHDIACYHKKPFVCEDSDTLMEFAKQTSPALAPRI